MKDYTVIPAVRSFKELEKALRAPSDIIFLLEGELIQLRNYAAMAHEANKRLFVHLELIRGIKEDEASVHYLAKELRVDGIISTRVSTLTSAKKFGLETVQRGFLLDSLSIQTIVKNEERTNPDWIELLPGIAFTRIPDLRRQLKARIILGGLIYDQEDVVHLFQAGAVAVSTSSSELWHFRWQQDRSS